MNFKKQVILIVKSKDDYIYQSDALDFFSISFHPEFDPNDFFAAARLLYELTNNVQITTIDEYANTLGKDEFKQLLGIMNAGSIIKSSLEEKIILIDYDTKLGIKSKVIPDIIKQRKQKEVQKRFVLLITESHYNIDWVNLLEAMYLGIYKQEDEIWEKYIAFQLEFPDLNGVDGMVITGAHSAAYDLDEPWMEPLYKFLQLADQKKIRMLGHQILAHCLGGKAQKMLHVPHMQIGRIELLSPLMWRGQLIEHLNVYQFHGDHVSILPTNAHSFLQAPHCPNFAFKNDHILGAQFHPEFNAVILIYIFKQNKDEVQRQQYENLCYESLKQGQDHQYAIWDMVLDFLKK